jgi:hypothetical protein
MNQTPNIILQRDTEVHETSPTIGIYGEENGMGFTSSDQAHIDTGFAGDATAIGQGKHKQLLLPEVEQRRFNNIVSRPISGCVREWSFYAATSVFRAMGR